MLSIEKCKPRWPYPPGPKGVPLVGSLFEMNGEQPWLTYENWLQIYGNLVFINAAGVNMLYLNSPEVVHDLLDKEAGIYSDRPDVPMLNLMGWDFNFAFMKYVKRWRTHSRLFHKYFHIRNIPNCYPALIRAAALLLKELAGPIGSTNVTKNVNNATNAFIMSVAYGHDIAPNSSDVCVNLVTLALELFTAAANPGSFYVDVFPSLMYIPEWIMPKWAFKRKASAWRPQTINFREKPYAMVRERMDAGTAKSCVATEMICYYLDDAPAERYAEMEDIIKNCVGIAYAAGSDTTLSSLSCFFLAMTLYPQIQKRAQDELDTVLAPGTMPTFEDRPQLPYIEAIMRETLRWHPVTPQGVAHRAMADNV